jgi:hypothetical protein
MSDVNVVIFYAVIFAAIGGGVIACNGGVAETKANFYNKAITATATIQHDIDSVKGSK